MASAFIVEDIEIARASLRKTLNRGFRDIEIIGEADGVISALKQIPKLKPDILFLDIDLPDGNAFDILECLEGDEFRIIFTTASENYAIRAFQVAAIDYLLKPIDPELLQTAVTRALESLPTAGAQMELAKRYVEREAYSDQIALHTTDKIRIVNVSEIIRCEASNNYTTFFFEDGSKELVAKTLKQFERILDPRLFLRTHQSHLVNFQYVKEFVKRDGGYLLLHNQAMIPVSVRKRAVVVEYMNKV